MRCGRLPTVHSHPAVYHPSVSPDRKPARSFIYRVPQLHWSTKTPLTIPLLPSKIGNQPLPSFLARLSLPTHRRRPYNPPPALVSLSPASRLPAFPLIVHPGLHRPAWLRDTRRSSSPLSTHSPLTATCSLVELLAFHVTSLPPSTPHRQDSLNVILYIDLR